MAYSGHPGVEAPLQTKEAEVTHSLLSFSRMAHVVRVFLALFSFLNAQISDQNTFLTCKSPEETANTTATFFSVILHGRGCRDRHLRPIAFPKLLIGIVIVVVESEPFGHALDNVLPTQIHDSPSHQGTAGENALPVNHAHLGKTKRSNEQKSILMRDFDTPNRIK